MTNLLTNSEIDQFESTLQALTVGLRNHVSSPIGLTHDPASSIVVTEGSSYKNSSGVIIGNATLIITFNGQQVYVPANIIT